MARARPLVTKVVDDRSQIKCKRGMGLIREEVWQDAKGRTVRYNLAFVNHHIFAGDNGRVLGYDTAHGSPHRHYMGTLAAIEPQSYSEVEKLRWL